MGERIERIGNDEDSLVATVVGKGSRKGSTFFGRAGDVIQRPPMWAAIAAGLSATGERWTPGGAAGQRLLPLGGGRPPADQGGGG